MRFRKTFLAETRDTLNRLGLDACTVCGSRDRGFLTTPVVLPIGGAPRPDNPDPEANFLFALALRCDTCGNLVLFDSEKFRKDQPTLVQGLTEAEEDELEAGGQ
jgi:hypothetical protein